MWHEGDFCEANTGKIGGRIEEALLHLGQIEQPGYGTFRYVTPVRMQAGLFKQTGEYLAHNSPAVAGAYLLLAFQRSTPPEGLACMSDFEFCSTQGLRFWHVEVNSGTDLVALGSNSR